MYRLLVYGTAMSFFASPLFTPNWTKSSFIKDGLISYVDVGEPDSQKNPSWIDISYNANSFELDGGIGITGAGNGAYILDGSTDFMYGSVDFKASPALTVSMWIYKLSENASDSMFLSIGTTEKLLLYTRAGDNDTFSVYSPTTLNAVPGYSSFRIDLNVWYNLACVYTSFGVYLYVNGGRVFSRTTDINPYTLGVERVEIGRRASATSQLNFNGYVAQNFIYNRALSSEEISHNFEALRGRYQV